MEATGSLHRAFAGELERRWPGALRVFAPSETQAARAQIGARRFKTDDRDCAALVWLARQGAGRPAVVSPVEAMLAAVAHRRQLVLALKPLRQRLHDQLNALAPGLSAPGRSRPGACCCRRRPGVRCWPARSTSRAAQPSPRSLQARAGGRLTTRPPASGPGAGRTASRRPPTPSCARRASAATSRAFGRCARTSPSSTPRSSSCWPTATGQVLTTLPGVATVRAAAFAAHSAADRALPDTRAPLLRNRAGPGQL